LERSIAFPFLPIAIGFMVQDHRVYKWFLNSFIWVLTGMVLIALIVAFSKNIFYNLANDIEITTLKSWFFTYHYLAGNVNITAIYFSLYISFAAVILLYNMYIQNILDNKWTNKMRYPIIVILSLGLILLSARTILFTYTLISLIIIGRYFYKRKKIFSFILGSISLFFVFGLLTAFNDVLYLRLKGIFQPLEETKYFSGGLYSRIYQWKAVFLEFCHNNILLGFGTGDSQNSYNKAYIDANLPWAEMDSFNIHNMYLESLFSMGLLGALILISILISSIYFAYVSKNKPYLIFLVIFMFAGLTESLLNRQYGIIFFIFVNFIFYYHLNERYIKNSHPRN
jgi:O-antigen ligase|tara:strand:- start:65 stop:1084 length:1020 start_codon:yes stop_codon:yes gene_type:complete